MLSTRQRRRPTNVTDTARQTGLLCVNASNIEKDYRGSGARAEPTRESRTQRRSACCRAGTGGGAILARVTPLRSRMKRFTFRGATSPARPDAVADRYTGSDGFGSPRGNENEASSTRCSTREAGGLGPAGSARATRSARGRAPHSTATSSTKHVAARSGLDRVVMRAGAASSAPKRSRTRGQAQTRSCRLAVEVAGSRAPRIRSCTRRAGAS